ncbi:MAG: cytochrome c3 family protein [Thermodesulfobacteriota bacterium]
MERRTGRERGFGWRLLPLAILAIILLVRPASALDDGDCLGCHNDPDMTSEKNGEEISLFVDEAQFAASSHASNGCTSCHTDAKVKGDEHPVPLKSVNCGKCHADVESIYRKSLHGQALAKNDPFAPYCHDCHGKHDILPASSQKSRIFILNVPATCGRCHREGSAMTKTHDIPAKNIIENYSMSMHGEGLTRKGLTVTAVCSSCHTSHNVQPHTNPESSISRQNVSKTCMKCHANIEQTHVKIVRGELWEKEPEKVPACVECHAPHKARRVLYEDSMNNAYCLNCHANPELKKIEADGSERSLFMDMSRFEASVHAEKRIACVKCHVNMDHTKNPVCQGSGKVDCAICHAGQTDNYNASIHGQLAAKGDRNAPLCTDCHGKHEVQARTNPESPTFARNVPELCGKCHREGEKAALRYTGPEKDIVRHYKESIHGKGLAESGLMVSATCTSCHTAHLILPEKDPQSTVNRANVLNTCATCHLGIAETFKTSIHSELVSKTDKKLPLCHDCHTSHAIRRVDVPAFRLLILEECGTCHASETETYFDTYHGKASLLSGGEKTAKCSDCHGDHDILPAYYTKSRLSRQNVVETCRTCHPNSNRKFTGYLTHATHHDKEKYPYLYYTFWAMSSLLIGTFAFFGVHTLFWIPRSFRERFKRRRQHSHERFFE